MKLMLCCSTNVGREDCFIHDEKKSVLELSLKICWKSTFSLELNYSMNTFAFFTAKMTCCDLVSMSQYIIFFLSWPLVRCITRVCILTGGRCSWSPVRGGDRGGWEGRPSARWLPAAQEGDQTYCHRWESPLLISILLRPWRRLIARGYECVGGNLFMPRNLVQPSNHRTTYFLRQHWRFSGGVEGAGSGSCRKWAERSSVSRDHQFGCAPAALLHVSTMVFHVPQSQCLPLFHLQVFFFSPIAYLYGNNRMIFKTERW